MSYVIEYALGDQLKSLRATIKDSTDTVVNITGYTVVLQASTADGPRFDYSAILTTTAASPTLTRSSGNFTTDGVQQGQLLQGAIAAFFPPGTKINAVGTTTVTMSQNALASTPAAQAGSIFGHAFSVTGALVDAVNGICKFDAVGNQMTSATMGQRPTVTYRAEIKATTGGLPGITDVFLIRIRRQQFV